MSQDDLAKLIEDIEKQSKEGLSGDMEIMPFGQVHPAIGSPKQHLETRSPAAVVALSKENHPGLQDHRWDAEGIAVNVGAGAAGVVIANYVVPKGQIAVLDKFGWSAPPGGFATLTFFIRRNTTILPAIPVAVPNVYLPSANTINPPDLAPAYETAIGPATFNIVVNSAAGVALAVSARLCGWYWEIGVDEKELGDRKYETY